MYEKVQADGSKVVLWKVCWGPINSLVVNQLDSKPLSSWPGITINYYTGTSSQAVDALMTAAEAGWTSALPGFAYAVAKIPKPQGGGQPAPDVRQVLFDVQGMLVRDPRSDATLVNRFYRDNPALCLADYETNINFGRGRDDAHVDWSGSVTTAANDCDAIIDGVSLKRFTFGLWGGDQKATDEWVTDMRAHAALVVVENSGLWQVWMDKSQAASGVVLSDTGAGANIIAAGPIRVSGGQQVWTRVRVNFTNAANGYKDDYAEDADPRIAIGTVPDIYKEVDLRGITTYDQARRIARYLRKRSGLDKTIPIKVLQDGGIQLLPGIRVPVTAAQIAFSNVDTLITQCTLNTDDGSWDVIVELYDATIYDDSQVSTTSVAPPIQLFGTTYWNQTQLGAAATVNGRVLTGKTSHIVLDVTTAATTLTLDDNIFAVGDRLYLESSPNGVNQTEFMAITAGPTGTGPYTYNVTRDLATTGAKAWRAGEMLFSTGQTGDGFIDLYGTRGVKSQARFGPTIVGNVRNSNDVQRLDAAMGDRKSERPLRLRSTSTVARSAFPPARGSRSIRRTACASGSTRRRMCRSTPPVTRRSSGAITAASGNDRRLDDRRDGTRRTVWRGDSLRPVGVQQRRGVLPRQRRRHAEVLDRRFGRQQIPVVGRIEDGSSIVEFLVRRGFRFGYRRRLRFRYYRGIARIAGRRRRQRRRSSLQQRR
jgi:hypothetical protein